jgi:oligopeptide/dipeptide ABC transporter ATP-binding protein
MYAGRIVEEGSRSEVLATPRHPYSEGLLRSLPGRARPGERLVEIPGAVPPPEAWPSGCRFAGRCPRAFEPDPRGDAAPCASEPDASALSPSHRVRCHVVARELRT